MEPKKGSTVGSSTHSCQNHFQVHALAWLFFPAKIRSDLHQPFLYFKPTVGGNGLFFERDFGGK